MVIFLGNIFQNGIFVIIKIVAVEYLRISRKIKSYNSTTLKSIFSMCYISGFTRWYKQELVCKWKATQSCSVFVNLEQCLIYIYSKSLLSKLYLFQSCILHIQDNSIKSCSFHLYITRTFLNHEIFSKIFRKLNFIKADIYLNLSKYFSIGGFILFLSFPYYR